MAAKKSSSDFASILQQYSANKPVEFMSTGSLVLDKTLGGGVASGSMYAIWGEQGSGKSTISGQIMKQYCKQGKKVVFIDVEKAFNESQQNSWGVREYVENGQIVVLTADNYQDISNMTVGIAESGDFSLVIVDSETAILPVVDMKELDVASARPGQKANQENLTMTQAKSLFYKKDIASIWIFHARANIQMTAPNPYAPATKQAGGWAAKHIPDVIVKVQPGQKIKEGDGSVVGQVLHVETEKNKFTMPFRRRDVSLFFGKGVSKKQEIVDLAVSQGIIQQSGSYFTLPDGSSVRGQAALKELTNDQYQQLQDMIDTNLI